VLGAQHVCNNGSMVTDVLAHSNGKEAKRFHSATTSNNDIEWFSGPLPSAGGLAAGSNCPTGALYRSGRPQEQEGCKRRRRRGRSSQWPWWQRSRWPDLARSEKYQQGRGPVPGAEKSGDVL
jgi:hypothetical protein